MNRSLLLAVVLAVTFASVDGFAGTCDSALRVGGTHPTVRPFTKTAQFYIDNATWLAANRNTIDPHTTHMEPMVPLAFDLVAKIEGELASKSHEPLYPKNEPLLRAVFQEIRDRAASRRFTYEYMAALPFRLGFLLVMSGAPASMIHLAPLFPNLLEASNYFTHENFIVFLEREATRSAKTDPILLLALQGIKEFPVAPVMPVFGNISYRSLNHLTALDVWTIGIITKPVHVDGSRMDEFSFPLHDAGHRAVGISSAHVIGLPIESTELRRLDAAILKQIETAPTSDIDFKILHFLHFMVMHESSGSQFVYRDAKGNRADSKSVATLKAGVEDVAKDYARKLLRDPQIYLGFADKIEEFENVLNGTETRERAMNRVLPLYLERREKADLTPQRRALSISF